MEYTLTIKDLLERPVIRNDSDFEFMNKMTDDEIAAWKSEAETILAEDLIFKNNPDFEMEFFHKMIDRDILYNIIKEEIDSNKSIMDTNDK
jgi:hypothetical protein